MVWCQPSLPHPIWLSRPAGENRRTIKRLLKQLIIYGSVKKVSGVELQNSEYWMNLGIMQDCK